MTDTHSRKRQPRGTTTGGQFATESRSESGVSLGSDLGHERPESFERTLHNAMRDEPETFFITRYGSHDVPERDIHSLAAGDVVTARRGADNQVRTFVVPRGLARSVNAGGSVLRASDVDAKDVTDWIAQHPAPVKSGAPVGYLSQGVPAPTHAIEGLEDSDLLARDTFIGRQMLVNPSSETPVAVLTRSDGTVAFIPHDSFDKFEGIPDVTTDGYDVNREYTKASLEVDRIEEPVVNGDADIVEDIDLWEKAIERKKDAHLKLTSYRNEKKAENSMHTSDVALWESKLNSHLSN